LIGYARVSTHEHTLDLQLEALRHLGCTAIFLDTVDGAQVERPELEQAVAHLREGDTLVIWRLDRLGQSLKHLIEIITALSERNSGFKSLSEGIDTTASNGELILQVFEALGAFERDLIRERTLTGLAAARARGRKGGRRPLSLTTGKPALALKLYAEKAMEIPEICQTLQISRATLFRWAKQREEQQRRVFAHEDPTPST
jgi:DNA invertase Pin-like site-specific DNA recombinase